MEAMVEQIPHTGQMQLTIKGQLLVDSEQTAEITRHAQDLAAHYSTSACSTP